MDPVLLESSNAVLNRKQFCIILVAIFGPRFFWEYEVYLDELMKAYGTYQPLEQRSDPMTRMNEVVREKYIDQRLTIAFHGYMEIMHACEEVHSGQKGMVSRYITYYIISYYNIHNNTYFLSLYIV